MISSNSMLIQKSVDSHGDDDFSSSGNWFEECSLVPLDTMEFYSTVVVHSVLDANVILNFDFQSKEILFNKKYTDLLKSSDIF